MFMGVFDENTLEEYLSIKKKQSIEKEKRTPKKKRSESDEEKTPKKKKKVESDKRKKRLRVIKKNH